jgi:TolB-like protein/DNA-binding winged helix-turn-helix (wHTH) protein/Tfp pilus assembly protein PilF
MERTAPARERYRVGDLQLDVGLHRVTAPAGEIAVPKLSFDLLLALVRRAPDFVSNEQLAALVWPGLVVTPDTVTKRVNLLREALGDSATNPKYVAGLRSRGYRIVAPVSVPADEPAPAAEPTRARSRTQAEAEVHTDTQAQVNTPAQAEAEVHTDTQAQVNTPAQARVQAIPDTGSVKPPRRKMLVIVCAMAALILMVNIGWWRTGSSSLQKSTVLPASAVDTRVAVMRFAHIGSDPADDYLADGLAEMVLDQLASVPQITVIARDSAFGIDRKRLSTADAAAQLGVRYLVEGSTQREGHRLRVTARLLDARLGTQVWSTQQDRPVAEIFAIQDNIANEVTDELRRRIAGITKPRPTYTQKPTVDAQLTYLQGNALLGRNTIKDAEAAVDKFEAALRLEPDFPDALAGLFDAHMLAAERRHEDIAVQRRQYRPLVERALAIDPACGQAYVARAIWTDEDPVQRETDFRHGLELDPSNGRGQVAYAEFLLKLGRRDEASRALDRALIVDPRAPRAHFVRVQSTFETQGGLSLEEGVRHVLEIDPDYQPALQRYAKYRWMHHGLLAEATQYIERAIELDPGNPWSRHTAAAINLDLGDSAAARAVAAATESSRATAGILIALHAGDWRSAGEAALSPAGTTYNRYESWGVAEAVRDYALHTQDTSRAIAFYEQRYGLQEGGKLEHANFRAATYLAQLLQLRGDTARAARLLRDLPPAIEATIARDGAVYALRTEASVQLLAGDKDAALATLARSFAAGDLMQWWYTLERDPLWAPLRNTASFQTIASQVHARVTVEQAAVAALQRSKRLPVRRPDDAIVAR